MIPTALAGIRFDLDRGFVEVRADGHAVPVSRRQLVARCEAAGLSTGAAWRAVAQLAARDAHAARGMPRHRTNAGRDGVEGAPTPITRQRGV